MRETTRLALSTLLIMAGAFTFAHPAYADQPRHFLTMPDSFVRAAVDIARDNLPRAQLPSGERVGEETATERSIAILPFAASRDVVNAGAASGFAAWCGVEWESRSFQPLMFRQRDSNNRSQKALAFIAVLHRVAQTLVRRDIEKAGPCKAEDRAAIDDYMNQVAGN